MIHLLALMTTTDEPPVDPDRVSPGLLGLVSLVFLVVAGFLLYKSLNKQIKRIDPNLPEDNKPYTIPENPPAP